MSNRLLILLGLSALGAGCASSPDTPAAAAALAADTGELLAAANDPVDVVEVAVDPTEEAHSEPLICRQMLQPASNQIIRRCGTKDQWKTYDRAQEIWAQQQLRIFQGSAFR
jgi:hypothetical protein